MLSRRFRLDGMHVLGDIRTFVEEAALAQGCPVEPVDDLIVAVNEAVTNVIVHGYKDRPGHLLLEVRRDGDRLLVSLEDDAPVFDPRSMPEPDVTLPLERRAPGGVGIRMMRAFTDELRHEVTEDGGNRLILIKRQTVAGPDS